MMKRPYSLVFALSAAFFAWIHFVPGFGDPDAYYHLRMTRLTMESGPVAAFPWLPQTTLADAFADHHFLYHIALAPFLAAFGDFHGAKIATVVFAALAVVAVAYLLKGYGVRRPYLWAPLLFIAPGFVFRLLLTKATAPALAALCLFLVALRRRHRGAAFAIAFAYVWLHGGWPLLLVAAAIDALVRRSARMFVATALGSAAGLVLNPFFPANLLFYGEQILQIAVLGRPDPAVLVGDEWYPREFATIFIGNIGAFLPMLAAAAAAAAAVLTGARPRPVRVDLSRRHDMFFAGSFAAILLLMTLRQARHQEYLVPMALLAGALVAETALAAIDLRALAARAKARFGRAAVPATAALVVACAAAAVWLLWIPRRSYEDRPPASRYADAGAWVRAHVPAGETIFHARWDDFPQLWYRSPEHRYIAGLDALFFYRKDPAKYWLWRDIGEGRRREGLAELIVEEFGARHVFLRMGPDPLRSLIKKDPSFERVYADIEAEVWRIRDAR